MNKLNNQEDASPRNAASGNFVIYAVAITFFVIFVYLGKEYSSALHRQEVAEQDAKKAGLLFDTPGALGKLIADLTIKAVKACGDDEVCFSKWKERDFPKYVDGMGLTENEKHSIAVEVERAKWQK